MTALELGFEAWHDCLPYKDNPYDKSTDDHDQWNEGWNLAKNDEELPR